MFLRRANLVCPKFGGGGNEAGAGRAFIFPPPLFLPAPPERSVWRAKRAVSSVQKKGSRIFKQRTPYVSTDFSSPSFEYFARWRSHRIAFKKTWSRDTSGSAYVFSFALRGFSYDAKHDSAATQYAGHGARHDRKYRK